MADEHLNPKMRYNPIWYQGWEFEDGGAFEVTENLDMKGFAVVNMREPQNDSDAATKKYVDDEIAKVQGGGAPLIASSVQSNATGQLQASNVQDALNEISNEGAFVDKSNIFTGPQTLGGATLNEVPEAVPYLSGYASPTGKLSKIESANNIDFDAPNLTYKGDLIPGEFIKYLPQAGATIQGTNVQEALEAVDTFAKNAANNYVEKSGLTADLSAKNNKITELGDGTDATDAVNKGQLDTKANSADLQALEVKVTANTTEISNITNGTTRLDADQVDYAPVANGVIVGKTNVQEAVAQADLLIQSNQQEIGKLQTAHDTFLTKKNGLLEGDLDAGTYKITRLANPADPNDAANRQYVDKQINALQGTLSGQLQWAGTYDCGPSQIVTLSDAGKALQDAQGTPVFTVGQNLPAASPTIKNYYFIAINKTPQTPKPPAPDQKPLSAGDWIIGDDAAWHAIDLAKDVAATNVSFTPNQSVTSTNVQKAIEEIDGDVTTLSGRVEGIIQGTAPLAAEKVSYTAKVGGTISGQDVTNVQKALEKADDVIGTAQAEITQNTTNIGNLQTEMQGVAKLASPNTFTAVNTFNAIPKLEASLNPVADEDIATVKKVNDTITANLIAQKVTYSNATSGLTGQNVQDALDELVDSANIKFSSTSNQWLQDSRVKVALDDLNTRVNNAVAGVITDARVQITKQLANLPGATLDLVLEKANEVVGDINDYVVNNSSFVGTYDANQNLVLTTFGLGKANKPGSQPPAPILEVNQPLPVSDDDNKAFFLIVKVAGTGTGNAPQVPLSVGDFIRSDGTAWEKVDAASMAADIQMTAVAGLTATNVQDALAELSTRQAPSTANLITVNPAIAGLAGANVQEVLTSAGGKMTIMEGNITDLQDGLRDLAATGVSFDNRTAQLPAPATNVQEAIQAVNAKIATSIAAIDAADVSFSSKQGIQSSTVAEALDELKLNDGNYVLKSGGELTGSLNAGRNKIIALADPNAPQDAATKKYVDDEIGNAKTSLDAVYVKRTGGQLLGDLDANNNKITNLAEPLTNNDAARKVDITNAVQGLDATYLKRTGGQLLGDLDANNSKITNLRTPAVATDAATKDYVDKGFVDLTNAQDVGGEKTFLNTANFQQGIDMMNQKIADLQAGVVDTDAINFKQLKDAIQGIQGQLTGKLTYCGTYNATTHQVDSVSTAGNALGFVQNQNIPGDSPQIANCFLITTVAGATATPLPLGQQLGVGDIILAQGGNGWLIIPIGSTRTASNVAVTPIPQIPNATNVQEALVELATKPAGNITASQVSFQVGAGIPATENDVQKALTWVRTNAVWTDSGQQQVNGQKTFRDIATFSSVSGDSIRLAAQGANRGEVSFTNEQFQKFCSIFRNSASVNTLQFEIVNTTDAANPAGFSFNAIAKYSTNTIQPTQETHLTTKKYVDDSIVGASNRFVTRSNGMLDTDLNANSKKITGLAAPALPGDAVNRAYMEASCVLTTTDQQIEGRKKFLNGIDVFAGRAFAFNVDRGAPAFFEWYNAAGTTRYAFVGFWTAGAPNKNVFRFDITNALDAGNPERFDFSHIVSYVNASTQPTDPKHLTPKKYVDDQIQNLAAQPKVSAEEKANIDVTVNIPGLAGNGTAMISYSLIKSPTGVITSALFGMKFTLNATWTPVASTTPTELNAAAHIQGQGYYQGLPIAVDTTLGGNYKTVAQIHLYRTVPTGGVNLIQPDAPIKLGRIVCLNDAGGQGRTKLFIVISYNQAIPVPQGTGAFYTMRYEGLPAMPI